ncbi:unnamed protein product [marine sediment metagenome]|uniref:Uncharacterized protein n=1 Tax=marine sediment metagenome TaxID=412755 RepID=X1GK57_9ZZZZ
MAKPIKLTPQLTGIEADKFLEKMIKVENSKTTHNQKIFAKDIKKNMNELLVC